MADPAARPDQNWMLPAAGCCLAAAALGYARFFSYPWLDAISRPLWWSCFSGRSPGNDDALAAHSPS